MTMKIVASELNYGMKMNSSCVTKISAFDSVFLVALSLSAGWYVMICFTGCFIHRHFRQRTWSVVLCDNLVVHRKRQGVRGNCD